MMHSDIKPLVEEKTAKKSFTWEIRNLTAYEDAPYVNFLSYAPNLMIGLGDVEMGGYKGKHEYLERLCPVLRQPPEGSWAEWRRRKKTKQKVHELTRDIQDPAMKVSVLYNYLQQNTHYVGIQLGIAGSGKDMKMWHM